MKWNDTRMGLTLFMRKRKVPTQPDLMVGGTISTTTVNNNENQVSAANFKVVLHQISGSGDTTLGVYCRNIARIANAVQCHS